MSLSQEARVGATALAGLAAACGLVVFLGQMHLTSPGYPVTIHFNYVDSLKTAAPVLYGGGEKIGEVDEITLDQGKVAVRIHVRRGVQIPLASVISIHTSGILGEKYVQVGAAPLDGGILADGAVVEGEDPGSLDRTLQKVEALTDFLQPLLADPKFRGGVENLLKGMSKLTDDLGAMIAENRTDVRQSVTNLKALTTDLRARSDELKPMLRNAGSILSDENTKKAQRGLDNLDDSLTKLDKILSEIDSKKGTVGMLVYDEETGENLRELLSDLKRHPWKLLWKK
jgi:phospholipid/cholesterol/gamma-HCH transport system substrate-binding protein